MHETINTGVISYPNRMFTETSIYFFSFVCIINWLLHVSLLLWNVICYRQIVYGVNRNNAFSVASKQITMCFPFIHCFIMMNITIKFLLFFFLKCSHVHERLLGKTKSPKMFINFNVRNGDVIIILFSDKNF